MPMEEIRRYNFMREVLINIYLLIGVIFYFFNLGFSKNKIYSATVGLILSPFWLFTIVYYFGETIREEAKKK
mgnify:CR=1 FL=1